MTTLYGGSAGFENALMVLGLIEAKFRPNRTTRRQLVGWIMDEFDCSKATGYRLAAVAIDRLGLEIVEVTRQHRARHQHTAKILVNRLRQVVAERHDTRGHAGPSSLGFRPKQVPRVLRDPGGD